MSGPSILGISQQETLGRIGVALLQLKNEDRLTLNDMGSILGRSDEMVAQYIAGEAEMGITVWFRARAHWGDRLDSKLEGAGK